MTAVWLEGCLSSGRGNDKANPVRDEMDASVKYDDGNVDCRSDRAEQGGASQLHARSHRGDAGGSAGSG